MTLLYSRSKLLSPDKKSISLLDAMSVKNVEDSLACATSDGNWDRGIGSRDDAQTTTLIFCGLQFFSPVGRMCRRARSIGTVYSV